MKYFCSLNFKMFCDKYIHWKRYATCVKMKVCQGGPKEKEKKKKKRKKDEKK